MSASLTLRIGVHLSNASGLHVTLAAMTPEGVGSRDGPSAEGVLDLPGLDRLDGDPVAYGQALGRTVFHGRALDFFREVRAETRDGFLRIHVITDPGVPELSRVYWERLADPERGPPFAIQHNASLVRRVRETATIGLPPAEARRLNALIAIADPLDLDTWGVSWIDRKAEVARIRDELHFVTWDDLAADGPVSAARLAEALKRGYDILYLLAHGRSNRDNVLVLMEGEDGKGELVLPDALAGIIAAPGGPRLVLLASCASAAETEIVSDVAPASLAPALIRGGTPVVVGMNGSVPLEVARHFFTRFIKNLRESPDIDRAANQARRDLQNQFRHWSAPVVFSSLDDGDIRWAPASFTNPPDIPFGDWEPLAEAVREGACVVVLGPSVTESARREEDDTVRKLVERHRYPLKRRDRSRVTGYIGATLGRAELIRDLSAELVRHVIEAGTVSGLDLADATLEDAVIALARWRAKQDENDLLGVVARLGQPLYITTDPFDRLEALLRDRGFAPISDFPRWKDALVSHAPPAAAWDENPEHPLVYHLFGRWSEPDSLVLTEGDLLDFLLAFKERAALPVQVLARLRRSTLLLAGFHLDDFDSHAVFRALVPNRPGGAHRQKVHVSANAHPDDDWADHPDRARGYFETYFDQASVSVHWGTVGEFATGLRTRTTQKSK